MINLQRGSLGAILLVAALTFILLKQRDIAFIGVGAGYEGYTKYVKPKPKPKLTSRFKPSTTYRPIRGQQTKQGSSVQQQHERVVKKYTPAQTKLIAELKQLRTPTQIRQYIANKVNRVIALVNAYRRLRKQPLLVRRPTTGYRPVQFAEISSGASVTSDDVTWGSPGGMQRIADVAKRLLQGEDLDTQMQHIVSDAVNEGVKQSIAKNFTNAGGAPAQPGITGIPGGSGQTGELATN